MDQGEGFNSNSLLFNAETADELLYGIYNGTELMNSDIDRMAEMLGREQAQEQRNTENEPRGEPVENNAHVAQPVNQDLEAYNGTELMNSDIDRMAEMLEREQTQEQRNAENEPRREPADNRANVAQPATQDLGAPDVTAGPVGQGQGAEQEDEQNGEAPGPSLTGTSGEQFRQRQMSEVDYFLESNCTSVNMSGHRGGQTAVPATLNSQAPSDYRYRVSTLDNTEQLSSRNQVDPVRHGSEYAEDLRWIASRLPDLQLEAAQDRIRPQPLLYDELQDSGRIAGQSVQGPDSIDFVSLLTALRQSGASCEEIHRAISIPRMPLLDDEMEHGFQRDVTDLRFNREPRELIPWTPETCGSPTLTRVHAHVGQIEGQSVILAEDLFNHLFQLSRCSFLQREEGVHLELWSHFMSTWRNASNFEIDAGEVITWMETTFVSANLATMTQNLINCIDGNSVVKQVVDKSKTLYNPTGAEMSVLGSYYILMSKHRDIMKSNKDFVKLKKDLDLRVKKARSILVQQGQLVPKTRNGKHKVTDPRKLIARENAMSAIFSGTRWLVVGSADAHYAYGCAVLETVRQMQQHIEKEHIKKLDQIKAELEGLESTYGGKFGSENDVIPGAVIAKKVLLDSMQEKEILRPVYNVERIVLSSLVETMNTLARIKVTDLFRCIGGSIPNSFVRALISKQEAIEKLRGVGTTQGVVVSDVLKVREMVEKAAASHEGGLQMLERKKEYLQECQTMINSFAGIAGGGGVASGAGPSSQRIRNSGRGTDAGSSSRTTHMTGRGNVTRQRNQHRGTSGGRNECSQTQGGEGSSGINNLFANPPRVLSSGTSNQYHQTQSGRNVTGQNNPSFNAQGGLLPGSSRQNPQTQNGGFVPGPSIPYHQAQSGGNGAGHYNPFSDAQGGFVGGSNIQYPQAQNVGFIPGGDGHLQNNSFVDAQGGFVPGPNAIGSANSAYPPPAFGGYGAGPVNQNPLTWAQGNRFGQSNQQLEVGGQPYIGGVGNQQPQGTFGGQGMPLVRSTGGPIRHDNRRYTRPARSYSVNSGEEDSVRRRARAGFPY